MTTVVIKRSGRKEKFFERKIYTSCYGACMSSHINKIDAGKICTKVTKDIKIWLKNKQVVSSDQIFKRMIKYLSKHNKDAAYMYKTHRDIS